LPEILLLLVLDGDSDGDAFGAIVGAAGCVWAVCKVVVAFAEGGDGEVVA
jgi:hypothetical protein